MTSPLPATVAERLESLDVLDPPAKAVGRFWRQAIPKGPVKDGLSGTWLGHALHPVLTDLPIGLFLSAGVLDVIGGRDSQTAADRLIATGLASAGAVFVTGWADWADAEPASDGVRRAGLVHALLNGTAAVLMAASYTARRRGSRGRGKLLALAANGTMASSGWIGGHLSLARGVGVATTAFDSELGDWTATGLRGAELAEGQPRCAVAGDVPVLVVRDGGRIHALHNRCSHRGGSLAEGEISDGTVTCPLHGSVFSLGDGSVERGPAAYPQPVFEARESATGDVEVRRAPR